MTALRQDQSVAADLQPTARRLSGAERRQQLFDVALALFAERGFQATTMDDVAEAAGVTKPLVYQHFSSKRALYLELVDTVAHETVSAITAAVAATDDPHQQVEQGFAAYFHQLVTRETAFRLLYGRADGEDAELDEGLHRVEDAIADAIDPLIHAGLEPAHRRLLAYAIVGMAEGATRTWLMGRAVRSPSPPAALAPDEAERLAHRIAELAWGGLRTVHAD